MQSIRLNLTPSGVSPRLYCSQYDVGRELKFELYDGAQKMVVESDETITIHGCKPDNHIFAYSSKDTDSVITIGQSDITIKTTEQMTAIAGDCHCELVISKGAPMDGIEEQVIGTINFVIVIEKSPIPDDGLTSASDLMAYLEMIKQSKDAISKAEEAMKKALELMTEADKLSKGHGTVSTVLKASQWSGTSAPYSYDIGAEYSSDACWIVPSSNATDEQIFDWKHADIYGTDGTTMYARKEKPTTDIPVDIIYIKLL